jgi:metal-dependent hydrolase (beta-lactamase superfamily II)
MKLLSILVVISSSLLFNMGDKDHMNVKEFSPLPIDLATSEPYSRKEAIEKGDIIWGIKNHNIERFHEFLRNTSNKKEDKIRITSYSKEGDPIFKDLVFDGEKYHYTYDNSHDWYGGRDKGIYKDICSKILVKEMSDPIFVLNGCSKQLDTIEYSLMQLKKEEMPN